MFNNTTSITSTETEAQGELVATPKNVASGKQIDMWLQPLRPAEK
jgi:hypothetical protein